MGATAEAYAWPEGQLRIWTGTASAVLVSYVSDTRAQFVRGWDNRGPSLGGTYTDHLTGQRADVSIGAAFTFDTTLTKMAEAATAVHMELLHSGINGTAGFKLWSGRFDSVAIQGTEGGVYNYALFYHTTAWTAY